MVPTFDVLCSQVRMERRQPVDQDVHNRPEPRDQLWTKDQIDKLVKVADEGGVVASGNKFSPRPSIALAVLIAYDTSLPQQDILSLKWSQFDGEGLSVNQKKKRGGREIYTPLSPSTIERINALDKKSIYIVVAEHDGSPYLDDGTDNRIRKRMFSNSFRKCRKRAGLPDDLQFMDLRRTALTEMGNSGATHTEIAAMSGHSVNSGVLHVYVRPNKEAGKRAAMKRMANQ